MRTDLWDQFDGLVGPSARLLATVTAHNADGTSSLVAYDGAQMRAIGILGSTIPYNVWVRDGRVFEIAPNLPLIEVAI
ncbi:hypothetical protein HH110_10640 [Stenotrophomonas sp. SAM-B]|uniref:hypothetical protein n=1 Tax=Stenotrophomonas sp. SAM-B TaxID=2729141 RepID=UPI0015A09BEB|nr:hypothetical protein [Stenotrophomonas sp. SAM-B]NWF33495.1 hypothetical protein [Stenotrophomonas sp. SAM-B]